MSENNYLKEEADLYLRKHRIPELFEVLLINFRIFVLLYVFTNLKI